MSVTSESRDLRELLLATDVRLGDGTFVRHENVRAASLWYGEDVEGGVNEMNEPGGNDGALRRIYHPFTGLCIVH